MLERNARALLAAGIYCFVLAITLTSCSSSKKINTNYLYFQKGGDTVLSQLKETLIQANDLLGIQVYSRTLNQEQAAIFNIPTTANSATQGYQVNSTGFIDMPVIGAVKAAGLTKAELQTALERKLTDNVRNPSVLVRLLQFNVNVLGEVRTPGTQKFNVDRVTIIDALSAAGDLTDFGKREDVMVIREEEGKKIYHSIDLRSKMLFQSPVYFLQPNDIVYVGPNKNKLKNIDVDPDSQRRTGLVLTLVSLGVSIASIIVFTLR